MIEQNKNNQPMTDEELMDMFGGFASGAALATPSQVDVAAVYEIPPFLNGLLLPPVIYGSIPSK